MRKCLVIFFLVLLPLQFSWAAVSAYCGHESGAAAKHAGHHDHEHKGAEERDTSPDPKQVKVADADCLSCHAGCVHALTNAVSSATPIPSSLGSADYLARLPSPPSDPLERPQWRVLA